MRPELLVALILAAGCAAAEDTELSYGGHVKLRGLSSLYPEDSLFQPLAGDSSYDVEGDLRLNLQVSRGRFSAQADYQLFALYGDTIEFTRDLPGGLFVQRLPEDDRRLMDLTKVLDDDGRQAWLHRFDRLWLGYASEKAVVRIGRQAISWGNGLYYSPMDLVNPFDPATIDTEYKPGDDMAYLQYLKDNGDDLQAAWVSRRDPLSGDVDTDVATMAAKYHGLRGESEFDLLVARHYGDDVVGLGGATSVGGAVLRGDVVVTDTDVDTYVQLVANVSYSWTWSGRNMSGLLEYYYNGFGVSAGNYDALSLAARPDLLARVARGELFTLSRNYLAGSVLIEMSPLWTVSPTLLANVDDPSALLQLITQLSLSDDSTFTGSINVPLGPLGSEFGGIESGGAFLATDLGIFLQVAFYF